MSARRLVAAGALLRRRPGGSALPEPAEAEVYEGRLPRVRPVPGANLLDVQVGQPKGRLAPVGVDEAQDAAWAWVPWCGACREQPVGGVWTLAAAEYLSRQHDAACHQGVWTAQAWPVSEASHCAGGAR